MNTREQRIIFFGIILFPLATLSAADSYQMKQSHIEFLVQHPFKDVHGKCVEIHLNSAQLIRNGNRFSIGLPLRAELNVDRIRTGNRNRDSHMLEVLGFPRYKTVTAVLNKITAKSDEEYELDGELTIKGTTRPLHTIARLRVEGDVVHIGGHFDIRLTEYRVERPALLTLAVRDVVGVQYSFRFGH